MAATQLPPQLCLPPATSPRDDTVGFSQFAFCIWPEESFAVPCLMPLLLLLLFCFLFKLYSKLLFKWQMVFCAPSSSFLPRSYLLCVGGGIGTCHKPFVNRQPDWIPWLSAVAKPKSSLRLFPIPLSLSYPFFLSLFASTKFLLKRLKAKSNHTRLALACGQFALWSPRSSHSLLLSPLY